MAHPQQGQNYGQNGMLGGQNSMAGFNSQNYVLPQQAPYNSLQSQQFIPQQNTLAANGFINSQQVPIQQNLQQPMGGANGQPGWPSQQLPLQPSGHTQQSTFELDRGNANHNQPLPTSNSPPARPQAGARRPESRRAPRPNTQRERHREPAYDDEASATEADSTVTSQMRGARDEQWTRKRLTNRVKELESQQRQSQRQHEQSQRQHEQLQRQHEQLQRQLEQIQSHITSVSNIVNTMSEMAKRIGNIFDNPSTALAAIKDVLFKKDKLDQIPGAIDSLEAVHEIFVNNEEH